MARVLYGRQDSSTDSRSSRHKVFCRYKLLRFQPTDKICRQTQGLVDIKSFCTDKLRFYSTHKIRRQKQGQLTVFKKDVALSTKANQFLRLATNPIRFNLHWQTLVFEE